MPDSETEFRLTEDDQITIGDLKGKILALQKQIAAIEFRRSRARQLLVDGHTIVHRTNHFDGFRTLTDWLVDGEVDYPRYSQYGDLEVLFVTDKVTSNRVETDDGKYEYQEFKLIDEDHA